MRFEKWQALGNDYVIVEERELPFELTPARVRAICAPHTGVGSDGVLLIAEADERDVVAEIRIFNPDGSEAELSGNGVRQAVMYLRRHGWAERGQLLRAHRGRRDPAAHRRRALHARHRARAPARRGRLPGRGRRRHRHAHLGRARVRRSSSCRWATRRSRSRSATASRSSTSSATGPGSSATSCSRTAPTCRSGAAPATPRSARASSSAAWGRRWRPAPAPRAPPWRPTLRGVESPVTVALDGGELVVDVARTCRWTMTGWARPVYAGTLSEEFLKELNATE